jgi:hypothetical protein
LRWGPFLVPLTYLAVVFAVQPPDHLGAPDGAPFLHPLLYDDYDPIAMILRGLNDREGRVAGRTDNPVWLEDDAKYSRALDGDAPLAANYYLEYPHGALPLFRLGLIFVPDAPLPPALLDGSQWDLMVHRPRTRAERDLWVGFRLATQLYAVLMLGCLFALILVLRAGYEPDGGLATNAALVMLPATIYYTLFRFDIVPALLTALSLACLGRRHRVVAQTSIDGCVGRPSQAVRPARTAWEGRPTWQRTMDGTLASGAFLAAAVMIKVYPVLLAPLVLRYLWPDRRALVRWLTAATLTAAAFVLPYLLRDGWQAVWSPYHLQLTREPHLWTAYDYILPEHLADNTPVGRAFRLGTLALTMLALVLRPMPDLASLLRRGAVLLIVFVSLAVFYSPQWVVWLTPLLLPLAARRRAIAYLVVALDLVTYHTWPASIYHEPPVVFLFDAIVYARFVVLAALVVALLWPDRPHQPRGIPCLPAPRIDPA